MSAAGLEALTLLDAIDGYLKVSPSQTALGLARSLMHEHDIENVEAWPHLEEAMRDDLHSRHWRFAGAPRDEARP